MERMRIVTAILIVGLAPLLGVEAHAESKAAPPVVVAGLPVKPLQPTATPREITPVQQQTCGCTAPPNPKQKLMVKSGGKNVCTVTQMACWAP
jgi:hypothetical protein